MWWLYFKGDHAPLFAARRTVWRAAYVHAVGFATVAATGAGLGVAVDVITDHAHATETVAVWSVAVPVSLYTAVLGVLHRLGEPDLRSALPAFVTAAAVLLVAAVGLVIGLSIGVAVLLVGVVMALSVAEHVVASRYFDALDGGEVPLEFLFSGTVFAAGPGGRLQATRISWESDAEYRFPVAVWQETMERYFRGTAWLRVRKDAFDRLAAYKARHAHASWEDALDSLLEREP